MMRLRAALALSAVAIVALLLGGTTASAGRTTIKLDDNFFSPSSKSIKKGTTVRFKWVGEEKHNVVKKKGPGRSFASETTDAPGVHFKKKFKKAGTYRIICTIHADEMKLKLKVN